MSAIDPTGNVFRLRVLLVGGVMLAALLLLVAKLYYVQVVGSEHYRDSISRQSVRRIRLPAVRGSILSGDFAVLAENVPSYDLVFYLQEMRKSTRRKSIEYLSQISEKIASAIGRDVPLTEDKIARHIKVTPGLPLTVFKALTPEELARALEWTRTVPGVDVVVTPTRSYPQGSMAAAVIGYTRFADPAEADDREDFFYYQADLEGKNGIEKAFDGQEGFASDLMPELGLHGVPGYQLVRVDHVGYVHAEPLEERAPRNGNNVVLTLDSAAQRIGESLLAGQRGALVLLNADTGDVLALVSMPTYDLSATTPIWKSDDYRSLLNDPAKPLYPRSYRGVYAPGSILKPLIALAALENGWGADRIIDCDGETPIGNGRIRCANVYGHGELDLAGALEKSCNDYLIEMGLATGLDAIQAVLRKAGIGENPGLELTAATGQLPSRAYKETRYGTRWNNYDTALLSIGQGAISLSPLQAARYTAALANGGTLYQTHLLKQIVSPEGEILFERVPEKSGTLGVSEKSLAVVRQGMHQVIHAPQGSGRKAQTDAIDLYGKTGTAEFNTPEGRRKNTWFICFGSHHESTYALAILVEEGNSGGGDCAPLAKQFFEQYLDIINQDLESTIP